MKNQVLTYGFFAIMVVSNLSCSHNQKTDKNIASIPGDSLFLKNVPAQPGEDTWKFIEDLKSPMWTKHPWDKAHFGSHEVDLSEGIKLQMGFPDPKGRLNTTYDDLRSFLTAGDVSSARNGNGGRPNQLRHQHRRRVSPSRSLCRTYP